MHALNMSYGAIADYGGNIQRVEMSKKDMK